MNTVQWLFLKISSNCRFPQTISQKLAFRVHLPSRNKVLFLTWIIIPRSFKIYKSPCNPLISWQLAKNRLRSRLTCQSILYIVKPNDLHFSHFVFDAASITRRARKQRVICTNANFGNCTSDKKSSEWHWPRARVYICTSSDLLSKRTDFACSAH